MNRNQPNRRRLRRTMKFGLICSAVVSTSLIASAHTAEASSATSNACSFTHAGKSVSAPPITAAPKTDSWREQYATAERTMFGLDSQPSAIAAASSDPNSTSNLLGTPLTPSEVQQLAVRNSARGLVTNLQDLALDNALSGFAGAWLDPQDQRHVDVAIIGNACPDTASIESRAPQGVSWSYVQAAGTVSYAQLIAKRTTLEANLPTLQSAGTQVATTHLDIPGDTFSVTVLPGSPPAEARLTLGRLLGAAGLVVGQGQAASTMSDPRNNPTSSVVYGGEDITSGSGRCTSNISLTNNNGAYGVLTAGHCFNKGVHASQNVSDSNLFQYNSAKSIGASSFQEIYLKA